MRSNRELTFQRDPAWSLRDGRIVSPALDFGPPGLESDAARIGYGRALPGRWVPARAIERPFENVPPWAQPAWVRRLP
jgi:hypothetical protein